MYDNSIISVVEEEEEFDLLELLFVLKRGIWALALCLALGATVAFLYTTYLIKPLYTSSSMIYIFSKTATITSTLDLQFGKQLSVDFEILGNSRPVIEKVISDLGLNTDYDSLVKTIQVENPTDSRIIKITVENTDPQLACDIANCLADNLAARVAEVIDTDKPSSVEDAVPASEPSSPSVLKNTAIGGLVGLIFAAAIILIRFFSDMSIRTEEDVAKHLGLGTLASIPYEKSINKNKKRNRDKK